MCSFILWVNRERKPEGGISDCQKRVAYQSAKINNLKMPASWEEKEMAGKDWLISFRRRHNITLKKPEACSLARATAFNKSNVSKFFDKYENLISRSPNFADGTRIFNLDETSTTTVQKPQSSRTYWSENHRKSDKRRERDVGYNVLYRERQWKFLASSHGLS